MGHDCASIAHLMQKRTFWETSSLRFFSTFVPYHNAKFKQSLLNAPCDVRTHKF